VKGAHNQDSLQLAEADLKVCYYRIFWATAANADKFEDSSRALRQLHLIR
jgi:hypothetical protein